MRRSRASQVAPTDERRAGKDRRIKGRSARMFYPNIQAMKAVILASGYLKLDGIHVCCVPEFSDVTIEDNVKTAIKLVIEPQHLSIAPTESTRLAAQGGTSQVTVRMLDPNV